jgi:hypothetical protein
MCHTCYYFLFNWFVDVEITTVIIMMKSSQQQAIEAGVAAATQDGRPLAAALASPEEVTLSSASAAESSRPQLLVQDQFKAAGLTNSAPSSMVKKHSTATGTPDIGILSKDFLKNKGRMQPIDKQFAIHRKKRAAAVDVDVGILSNGRRRQQKAFDANLHAKNENEVLGRSLQSGGRLPYMCPTKDGGTGFYSLFNETTDSYFPKCSCPSPTTCGPDLCECLELDADGDILQCMDSFNQLCEGTKYIEGIPGPWSMEECLGEPIGKFRAIAYCSYLPCFVEGGSFWQCRCNLFDIFCTEYRDEWPCARSKCCQAQTNDEGRKACIDGYLHENYYDQVTIFSISREDIISRFNECSFNSDNDKSIVQCYCESFAYGECVKYGVGNPDLCEAMNCCWEQTEDDARLECFTNRFRIGSTGYDFYNHRDTIQESCVASGRSSDQCKCDIQGLTNCVGNELLDREPRCDLFQCCQSQTSVDDEGRKDCLVQDEAQLVYEKFINDGNTTESCVCDKSNTLCVSGHSNDRHCELSSCCQEQTDDTGRKECIGNFTTSQSWSVIVSPSATDYA